MKALFISTALVLASSFAFAADPNFKCLEVAEKAATDFYGKKNLKEDMEVRGRFVSEDAVRITYQVDFSTQIAYEYGTDEILNASYKVVTDKADCFVSLISKTE